MTSSEDADDTSRIPAADHLGRDDSSNAPSPVTIVDVARFAGVSHSTVSRVLNDHPNIRPATRKKVEEALNTLGYVPNLAARSLVRGEPMVLGTTVFDLTSAYNISILQALDQTLADAGIHLLLYASHRDKDRSDFAGLVVSGSARGLIVVGAPDTIAMLDELNNRGVPSVLIDYPAPGVADSIVGDNRDGARQALGHLLELGHRRIGLIVGDTRREVAEMRRDATLEMAAEAGLSMEGLVATGSFRETASFEAAMELLKQDERPTAIVTPADSSAFGVMQAAAQLGISIPDQLSIVGFDDVADAARSTPTLTTVRQPFERYARRALSMIEERLADRTLAIRHETVPVELIVRESTAPPPA